MNKYLKSIWCLRRDEEKKSGRPVVIYSAYPLIGRGSVIHKLKSHDDVVKDFEKSLHVPFMKKIVFFVNRILAHA